MFGAARQKLESNPTHEETQTRDTPNNWTSLVNRIREGDDTGLEELYRLFSKGVRYFLCRQLGTQDVDDRLHDTFIAVVHAIQRGDLREPERLMGFVKTIAYRQAIAGITQNVQGRREQVNLEAGSDIVDNDQNPEQAAIERERREIIRETLGKVPPRDREILTRFYIRDESQQQIRKAMNLTETQYRLLKSRAKARFGEAGKKRIVQNPITAFFERRKTNAAH